MHTRATTPNTRPDPIRGRRRWWHAGAPALLVAGLVTTVSVHADAVTSTAVPTGDRNTVSGLEFLGQATVPTGTDFAGTEVGGLSGISYDPVADDYIAISDDRVGARTYDLTIDLTDGALSDGDVVFTGVSPLLDTDGQPFADLSLDPEGIALAGDGSVFISSEGDANALIAPFVRNFATSGETLAELDVPSQFIPDGTNGPRNNLVFESMTLTPDESLLYTATENALVQDGPAAALDETSPSRILVYGPDREPMAQYVYETDEIPDEPIPADAFATNGLVELLAIDDDGTLLALERAFSVGVGNSVKLYEVYTGGAVDVSSFDGIGGLEADPTVSKRLVFDFADLGLTLDNLEAMTFGPPLPDGRPTLIVVSDNNFSQTQFTQFLAFAVDVDPIPLARPTLETPRVVDDLVTVPRGEREGDTDDPAIWVHPTHPDMSRVIGTLKEGGLQVTDLKGNLRQVYDPPGVSYNNVDIIYDFPLTGGATTDVAIASDRANDVITVFSIAPGNGRLSDITAVEVPDTIFGVDDGESTAYGLAAYTSPTTGRNFVFVTQASGNQIAQLEIRANYRDKIVWREARRLEVPVDGDVEDAQTEGVVADPDLAVVHIAMEDGAGILTFDAEPDGGTDYELLYDAADGVLAPDIEGLDLYLATGTNGYIVASSQGDSTFHVWERDGDRAYLGRFGIGATGSIDATDESDGFDIVSTPIGSAFPQGLMVAHDGQDLAQFTNVDEDEIENAATNFKFVSWGDVAAAMGLPLDPSRPVRGDGSVEYPVRFATFNASLNRGSEGELAAELATPGSTQPAAVAEIVQTVRPEVLLINEFDYDPIALQRFQDNYLEVGQSGRAPIFYEFSFIAPSNTGVMSGFDYDNSGTADDGPGDAYGFGFFPGQYGMAVLSIHPIDSDGIRTFQQFKWNDMPGALLPDDPATSEPDDYYTPGPELDSFRLSSKSHWDVPIDVDGEVVHFLVSHPTPPVFDDPVIDWNGRRNHDEIRFWADYIGPGRTGSYIYDDDGVYGGLGGGAEFVIAGDLNSDPNDGDSIAGSAQLLLDHPLVNARRTPSSDGAVEQASLQGGANATHVSDPAFDTADFADGAPGNLRADYVLPRKNLRIVGSGVHWPLSSDPAFGPVGTFPFPASDHRLVWVDLVPQT